MAGSVNNVAVVRITAAANGVVPTSITMSRNANVVDFVAFATDAGGQTVQLSLSSGATSAALSLAAGDTACVRPAKAGTWTAANTKVASGAQVTITPGGAQAYEAYVYLYPTPPVSV